MIHQKISHFGTSLLMTESMRVHLKVSKTDSFRFGVDVFVGRTGNDQRPLPDHCDGSLCVVGGGDGPLFLYKDGRFLMRESLVAHI